MTSLIEKEYCCGCHACANICPKKCIAMKADCEGFLYPEIDSTLCVDCGLCRQACPQLNKATPIRQPLAYAVQNLDDEIRKSSSSGGVFTLLAESVIQKGGIVFGAAFDVDFNVQHISVSSISELENLRGSKYVQSTVGNTYAEAKQLLDSGRLVLYTGTPCQIAGLLSFLGKKYDNLLTQDIICHGVPSPMAWEKYLNHRKNNTAITSASFRSKDLSWRNYQLKLQFSDQPTYSSYSGIDPYLRCFLSDLCLRPSCHNCLHKTKSRVSDITLADFWGIEHILPELDDDFGTSLVVIHSAQGHALFDSIKDNASWASVDLDSAVQFNSAMIRSAKPHPKREKFFRLLSESGFSLAAKHCLPNTTIQRIKMKVKRIIKRFME